MTPHHTTPLPQLTDYEQIRVELRRIAAEEAAGADAGSVLPEVRQHDKLVMWQLMARQCFTRSMAAAWLIPLLDLLVRVKLHVIGGRQAGRRSDC